MTTFYLIGKLAESPRGKRLLKSLGATPTAEPPTGTGFVTAQVVGRASRLSGGRLALGPHAGETPGTAGETPAPLPEQLRRVRFCRVS